jgi:hypothetical protein
MISDNTRKYRQSPKGKAAFKRWLATPKGKALTARAEAKRKILRQINPEHYRAIARNAYHNNKYKRGWERRSLAKLFGLTQSDKWTRLFGDQNGRCANPTCSVTAHTPGIKWSIHHIHDSRPMRWCVCCSRCNWASGKFKDDPIMLRGMADLNENLTPDGYHTPSLIELVEEAQHF